MIVIKDQHNSLGEKLEAIKKQDVQMNDLIISNKEHDVKIEKIQFEHDAKGRGKNFKHLKIKKLFKNNLRNKKINLNEINKFPKIK